MIFQNHYVGLLQSLLQSPTELNQRTGQEIHVMQPTSFTVDLSDGALPVCGVRKLNPGTAAAELAWFLQGTQDVTWLRRHTRIWDQFVEEDGVTVQASYGYRWANYFGRNQLAQAMNALIRNPSDRRCFVSAWDPSGDGLGQPGQKNVPCPIGFTLSVTGGRVNSTVLMRSSDVFVGLPYDCMGQALLVRAVAQQLGLQAGFMQFSLAHPHLYSSHVSLAREALNHAGPLYCRGPMMPDWSVSQVYASPDEYVALVKALCADYRWPPFNPRPEVFA